MSDLQKYFSRCLLVTAALLGGAFPTFAAAEPATATASKDSSVTAAAAMLSGRLNPAQPDCNQGVGNGPDLLGCDPGNSDQGDYYLHSNDEFGGVPGSPGRQGGKK